MTRDEIVTAALAAGFKVNLHSAQAYETTVSQFERLAELLVAKECEACAQVAEREPRVWDANAKDPQHRIAEAIRARNK